MSTDMRAFDLQALKERISSGANWFYWIAGFSAVNLLVIIGNGNIHFIIGSAFVEAFAGLGQVGSPVWYVLAAGLIGLFAYLGKTCNDKPAKWPFIMGMIVYTLDGLVFVAASDFLPALFHVYVLYRLYQGMAPVSAYTELEKDIAQSPVQVIEITPTDITESVAEAGALPPTAN